MKDLQPKFWICLAIGIVGLVAVAHMFRYSPVPTMHPDTTTVVWDRWLHRTCVIHKVGDQRTYCYSESTSAEYDKYLRSFEEAQVGGSDTMMVPAPGEH